MLQSGAGVRTVLIDARGKDPKVKKTENCNQFESEASGICHFNLSAGQKSNLMKQIIIRRKNYHSSYKFGGTNSLYSSSTTLYIVRS